MGHFVGFALALLVAAWPAAGKEVPVDVELVFAVDISGSIDMEEAQLQREGYLSAFTDPDVVRTIKTGFLGRIAASYVEWAGRYQMIVADWTLIEDEASARAFARKIARAPIMTEMWTSISGAVNFAMPMFEKNGYSGTRRIIDISGDGPNNVGEFVPKARDRAIGAGFIINGLPIMNDRPSRYGWPAYKQLDVYYVNCVIGGPGAFIVIADGFQDFARAIRKKMILEIAGHRPPPRWGPPPRWRIVPATWEEKPTCDMGEKRREWLLDEDPPLNQ